MAQAAWNLVMDLEDAGCQARFLVRPSAPSGRRERRPAAPAARTDHLSPITYPEKIIRLGIRRHERLGGILHKYQYAA